MIRDISVLNRIFLIASLALIALGLVTMIYRRFTVNRLISLLAKNDFEGFERLANRKTTLLAIRPYNIAFMQLNVAMMKGDDQRVKEILNAFGSLKMNEKQKIALYSKAFYYFTGKTDRKQAEKYYKKLSSLEAFPGREQVDRMYDTFVASGYSYLDETLAEYEKADEKDKLELEIMLMNMYANKGDMKEAQRYEALSAKRMGGLQKQKEGER